MNEIIIALVITGGVAIVLELWVRWMLYR